jgi:hypothetical protein
MAKAKSDWSRFQIMPPYPCRLGCAAGHEQAMADFKAAWERTPRLLKQADCPKGQYLDRKFSVQI